MVQSPICLHHYINEKQCINQSDTLIFESDRFIDPLVFGDYPISMRTRVKNRLPRFTSDEAALIKGSLDFVGINHYTTYYAQKSSTDIIGRLLNDTLADSGAATLRKFIVHSHEQLAFVCVG